MYVTLSLTYLSNLKIKSWRKPEKIVVYPLNKGHFLIIWQIPGTTPPMCRKTTICLDRIITQIYKKKIQYWVVCEPSDFKIQVLFAKSVFIYISFLQRMKNFVIATLAISHKLGNRTFFCHDGKLCVEWNLNGKLKIHTHTHRFIKIKNASPLWTQNLISWSTKNCLFKYPTMF